MKATVCLVPASVPGLRSYAFTTPVSREIVAESVSSREMPPVQLNVIDVTCVNLLHIEYRETIGNLRNPVQALLKM